MTHIKNERLVAFTEVLFFVCTVAGIYIITMQIVKYPLVFVKLLYGAALIALSYLAFRNQLMPYTLVEI